MLFRDDTFESILQYLCRLPFTQADLEHGLNRLPITKALVLDGCPAVVWRHFSGHRLCIRQHFTLGLRIRDPHHSGGPPDGFIC